MWRASCLFCCNGGLARAGEKCNDLGIGSEVGFRSNEDKRNIGAVESNLTIVRGSREVPRAQITEHRAQRTLHRAQSTEHSAQSTEHRAQSTAHRAQSTEHRARSSEHGDGTQINIRAQWYTRPDEEQLTEMFSSGHCS